MADTIRSIAKTNGRSFYTGEIAERTDAFMKAHNGFLTGEDLAAYSPEWVNPISVNYRGVDVWNCRRTDTALRFLWRFRF